MRHKKIIITLTILLVLITNLFFGFSRLSHYSAVDEPYWIYKRIPKFWTAIQKKKWRSTNINDKPGITVALISGIGLFSINPLPYKSLRQERKTKEVIQSIAKINFSFRYPIYFFSFLFLLFFFWFLKKLLGTSIALVSLIFIGLSPILLGISLIVNPDSLLWGFLPLTILSYFIYQKERKKSYLILTGILFGLSLLTKYVANILYVYFLLLIFLEYLYTPKTINNSFLYFKKAFFDFSVLIAISMGTFFLLFPATWKHPKMVLEGTIFSKAFQSTWPIFLTFLSLILLDLIFIKSRFLSAILNYLSHYKKLFKKILGIIFFLGIIFAFINVYNGMKFFDFQATMASPKGGEGLNLFKFTAQTTADLYVLIFGLTPWVFLAFCYAIFLNTWRKVKSSPESNIVFYFLIFIFIYYLASSVNHIAATVRYQIVLYPLAFIVAATGFVQFLRYIKIKQFHRFILIYPLLIILSFSSLLSIAPFYFTYASSLLPTKYILNLKDMGDGSYEASQYLNQLPNANELTIWSDKGATCESFLGRCKVGFHKNDVRGIDFNYFVVSIGRKSRSLKMSGPFKNPVSFSQLYATDTLADFRINFDQRKNNFIKVIKTKNFSN